MTRIKIVLWVLCGVLTVLWFAADPVLRGAHPFAQTQIAFINYTGIVAMGAMSVAMLLALRSVRLEPYVGGLDKSYRLHKWLGVVALVAAIAHWLWIQAPGWLVAMGAMSPPARGAAGGRPPAPAGLMHALQGPARSVGQICFWAAVALIVLALVKWFPYRHFIRTHRLLALVFVVLVFHSVVLLKTAYWAHTIAYVITVLMAIGIGASVITLLRRVGRTRQAVGEIESVTPYQNDKVLGVSVCLKDRWPGHDAGQFAFLHFADDEEPHPFTISSTWKDDGRLVFLIKGLVCPPARSIRSSFNCAEAA